MASGTFCLTALGAALPIGVSTRSRAASLPSSACSAALLPPTTSVSSSCCSSSSSSSSSSKTRSRYPGRNGSSGFSSSSSASISLRATSNGAAAVVVRSCNLNRSSSCRALLVKRLPSFGGSSSEALTLRSVSHLGPSVGLGLGNGSKWFAISHGRRVPKLGRPADQRKALLRGLTTELLRHGRIKTTKTRARAMRKYVDHMITLAKGGSLHQRRQALGFIYDKQLVHSIFAEVPGRYGERNGGYTRIIRTMPRRGDNAPMAFIELV